MAEFIKELCDEKHRAIESKITKCEKWLDEHEEKIGGLEKENVKNGEHLKSVCEKLGGLTKALWAVTITIFGAVLSWIGYLIQAHFK